MRKIWVCLLCIFIASCDIQSQKPFRIGANNWPGYAPLFLAQHQASFKDQNLHVINLPSASEAIHALRMGNLEAAALTLDEALSLAQDDFALTVILIFDFSHGGDALIASPSVKSLKELRGKRVAVESTAVGAVMLDAALDKAGLALSDIQLVDCEYGIHESCFDEVDALVTFEPMKSKLVSKGGKVLFDSTAIPGKIVDVLVVRSELIKNNVDRLQAIWSAYFKARNQLLQDIAGANRYLQREIGLSDAELARALQGVRLPSMSENIRWLAGGRSRSGSEKADPTSATSGNPTSGKRLAPIIETARTLSEVLLERKLLRKRPLEGTLSAYLPVNEAELAGELEDAVAVSQGREQGSLQ